MQKVEKTQRQTAAQQGLRSHSTCTASSAPTHRCRRRVQRRTTKRPPERCRICRICPVASLDVAWCRLICWISVVLGCFTWKPRWRIDFLRPKPKQLQGGRGAFGWLEMKWVRDPWEFIDFIDVELNWATKNPLWQRTLSWCLAALAGDISAGYGITYSSWGKQYLQWLSVVWSLKCLLNISQLGFYTPSSKQPHNVRTPRCMSAKPHVMWTVLLSIR